MTIRKLRKQKILITVPEDQLRIIDGLVAWGAAPSRSALIQQIIGAFVTQVSRMKHSSSRMYEKPMKIENAVEALIAYFLYVLGKAAIDALFGSDNQ